MDGSIAAPEPDDATAPRQSWPRRFLNWLWKWRWAVALLLLIVFRAGLFMIGIKERLPYPRFGLSVFHVPWLILGFAGGFAMLRRAATEREGRRIVIVFLVLAFLDLLLLPVLLSDNGLMLFALPVLFYALTLATPNLGRISRWALAAPAVGVLLAPAVAAVVLPHYWGGDWSGEIQQVVRADVPDGDAAARILGRINETSQNRLRVGLAFYPDLVARAGTDQAEALARWSSQLRDYSSSRFGEGFMAPSDPAELKPVQVDDNVTAIHLLYPFGRFGTAALLAVLAAAAWAAPRLSGAPDGGARIAAQLTLWTWFALAAYMVLANMLWLPFTGRNFYFLAAYSWSDLLEASLLAILAVAGLRSRRPA